VFRKLGTVEAAERKAKWEADVSAGRVVTKHRASRCDAGQPRKRMREEEGDEDEENEPTRAQDSQGNDSNGKPTHAPPKKRARKMPEAAAAGAAPRSRAKKAAPAKSAPKTSATGKKGAATAKKNRVRDDPTTQAALQRLKSGSRARALSAA
jgi:hypothetical protein